MKMNEWYKFNNENRQRRMIMSSNLWMKISEINKGMCFKIKRLKQEIL